MKRVYVQIPLEMKNAMKKFENKHWVLKVFESQMKRISIYKCQSQKNLVGWHIHPDLRLLDWIIYLPHRTRASRLELIYWNLSLNWAKSNFQHFSVSNKVFSIHPSGSGPDFALSENYPRFSQCNKIPLIHALTESSCNLFLYKIC